MQWNIYKLITAGSLGVLLLVLALAGSTVTAVTGVPGAGGIINIFISGAMFAFCCLLLKQFGSATLMGVIYGICAIPLPLLGTPGFLPKIVIGTLAGLIADCLYALLKRHERIAAPVIGAFSQIFIGLSILGLGLLFSLPGIEKFLKILSPIALVSSLLFGAAAGYVGYLIFSRLRETAVVRKIQGGQVET